MLPKAHLQKTFFIWVVVANPAKFLFYFVTLYF